MLAKMTRYIWCPDCYGKLIIGKGLKSESSEKRVIFSGKAEDDFLCDNCGTFIVVGDLCFAVTFVEKAKDHTPWEEGYLADAERIE